MAYQTSAVDLLLRNKALISPNTASSWGEKKKRKKNYKPLTALTSLEIKKAA